MPWLTKRFLGSFFKVNSKDSEGLESKPRALKHLQVWLDPDHSSNGGGQSF